MRRKSLFASIAALLCALALGFAAPAQAATPTGTIKVTSDANSTSTLYRIISTEWDGDANNGPVYTWDSAVATWLRTNNYGQFVGDNNVVTADYKFTNDADGATFFGKLATAIAANDGNAFDALKAAAVTVDGPEGTTSQIPLGSYLIVTSNKAGSTTDARVYNPSVVNLSPEKGDSGWVLSNQEKDVKLKSTTTGIEKNQKVDDHANANNDDTIGVGKTVTYTISATVPAYSDEMADVDKRFTIVDTMSKGLAYNPGLVSIKVEGDDASDLKGAFTVTRTGDDATQTVVTFTGDYSKLKQYANKKVVITYQATVTANAVVNQDMTNHAQLQYGHDYTTDSKDTHLHTYGLDVLKYSKADTNKNPLAGAEFKLSTSNDVKDALWFVATNEAQGEYRLAKQGEAGATQTLKATVGKLHISGLDAGAYYLFETKAPDNYQAMVGGQQVTITASKTGDSLNGAVDEKNPDTTHIGFSYAEVANSQGFSLPVTGGTGTLVMTTAAVVLLGAGASIAMRKRGGRNAR